MSSLEPISEGEKYVEILKMRAHGELFSEPIYGERERKRERERERERGREREKKRERETEERLRERK